MLKFGTSGLRGLVTELTDQECYLYTTAFIKYLLDQKLIKPNSTVAIAGDLRPSTGKILIACMAAIRDNGFKVDYCGIISTQAVSLYGFKRNIPSIMVTGSHIPYDRNGIKFNLPDGEVLKKDEQAITAYRNKIVNDAELVGLFKKNGAFKKVVITLPKLNPVARREYIARYTDFFPANFLRGKTIVVYQHSSVMRDIMVEIIKKLGAKVVAVGRSDKFIPIDTEAMHEVDLENAKVWAKKYKSDAIISADGDGDRPVLFDNDGNFIRGDYLGILCSSYLRADAVSVTASCNTALEKCKKFINIARTKIGSPFVIEAMNSAKKKGAKRIVSYEANGGFLTGTNLTLGGKKLISLPTRDSMLPVLSALALASKHKLSLSKLTKLFPQRFVYSQSIKGFPTETSQKIIQKISKKGVTEKKLAKKLFGLPAEVKKFDFTDGARMFLSNNEIVHIRPSGNAPEIRAYSEADTFDRARELTEEVLKKISGLV